jgi:hypothetical protein
MGANFLVSGRNGFERHANPVHAVAQACYLGAVVEQVPEMPAATAAMDLYADHAERSVPRCADRLFVQRCPEAWPAGAALELGLRRKQAEIAARAGEDAWAMLIEERARKGSLGRALPQYRVLIRRQQLASLGIRVSDLESLFRRRCSNKTVTRPATPPARSRCCSAKSVSSTWSEPPRASAESDALLS